MTIGARQAARVPAPSAEQLAARTEDLAELWRLDLKGLGPLRLGHRCSPSAHLAAQALLGQAADLRDVPVEELGGALGPRRQHCEAPRLRPHARGRRGRRFSVIVVHKMDRFARELKIVLECLERLGRARAGFGRPSAAEPVQRERGRSTAGRLRSAVQPYFVLAREATAPTHIGSAP